MRQPIPVAYPIRDMCTLIEENPTFRGGIFKARAAALAERIDQATNAGEEFAAQPGDLNLVVDMCEAIALAAVNGAPLKCSMLLMRMCERVIVPITDALGYREQGR